MKYSELKNILRIYYSESMIGKILAPNILQKPSIKNAVILEKKHHIPMGDWKNIRVWLKNSERLK